MSDNVKTYASFISEQMRILKGKGLVAEQNLDEEVDQFHQRVFNRLKAQSKHDSALRSDAPTDAHLHGLAAHIAHHEKRGMSQGQAQVLGNRDWHQGGKQTRDVAASPASSREGSAHAHVKNLVKHAEGLGYQASKTPEGHTQLHHPELNHTVTLKKSEQHKGGVVISTNTTAPSASAKRKGVQQGSMIHTKADRLHDTFNTHNQYAKAHPDRRV